MLVSNYLNTHSLSFTEPLSSESTKFKQITKDLYKLFQVAAMYLYSWDTNYSLAIQKLNFQ